MSNSSGKLVLDTKIDDTGRTWINSTAGLKHLSIYDFLSSLYYKSKKGFLDI